MSEPKIEYEVEDRGEPNHRVKAKVIGANGEVQFPTEWYDSKSNARRGLAEAYRTLHRLVELGEIDPDLAT